jgi:hypothetical protein
MSLTTSSPLRNTLTSGAGCISPTDQATAMSVEAARVRERFERVLSAGVAMSAEHSLGAVIQRVVDSACAMVGARYAALVVQA